MQWTDNPTETIEREAVQLRDKPFSKIKFELKLRFETIKQAKQSSKLLKSIRFIIEDVVDQTKTFLVSPWGRVLWCSGWVMLLWTLWK